MVVTTAIVVDTTTTMAPISTVDNVVASIVVKSNLAFGTLAAPAVGGLAEPSAELLLSAVDNVVASIVVKSNLAFGTLAAPAVRGLAEPSAELLQSFAKETLADTVRLLAFDRTDSSPGVNA